MSVHHSSFIHQKERGDPPIIYPQHLGWSWGKLKYVEALKSASVGGNDQFQMLGSDLARFKTQDATLKCGNDFLSLSTRLLPGSCTYDWLKLKARSALGGRNLVRNRCRRSRGQTNKRQSGCIQFSQHHGLFKSRALSEKLASAATCQRWQNGSVFSSWVNIPAFFIVLACTQTASVAQPLEQTGCKAKNTSMKQADKLCVHANFSIRAHL